MKILITIAILSMGLCLSGCQGVSNELILNGGGAAAGAACGYAIDKKSPWATVAGATAGTLATSTAINSNKKSLQKGFDMGYIQGSSDAIKRHYWMRQNMHSQNKDSEKTVYLSIPAPRTTEDGRELVAHNVLIPIVE